MTRIPPGERRTDRKKKKKGKEKEKIGMITFFPLFNIGLIVPLGMIGGGGKSNANTLCPISFPIRQKTKGHRKKKSKEKTKNVLAFEIRRQNFHTIGNRELMRVRYCLPAVQQA